MTRVKFKMFKGEVLVLFPDELYNERLYGKDMIMSYARIGQHGGASSSLLKCRNATPEQYSSLLKELINIGYNDLKVG